MTREILDKTAHVPGVGIGGTGINWRGHVPLPPRRHRRWQEGHPTGRAEVSAVPDPSSPHPVSGQWTSLCTRTVAHAFQERVKCFLRCPCRVPDEEIPVASAVHCRQPQGSVEIGTAKRAPRELATRQRVRLA